MQSCVYRVQKLAVEKLVTKDAAGATISMSAVAFCNPKFCLMRHWPDIIRKFGSANLTSTGYGERSHVALKQAFKCTNQHSQKAINAQASPAILPTLQISITCSSHNHRCLSNVYYLSQCFADFRRASNTQRAGRLPQPW